MSSSLLMYLKLFVSPWAKVLVPEPIHDTQDSQPTGDHYKHFVLSTAPLRGNVLILTSPENRFVNRVKADVVRVSPDHLIVLRGQMVHTTDLSSKLVDVADFGDASDGKVPDHQAVPVVHV